MEQKGFARDTALASGETTYFIGSILSRRLFLIIGYVHAQGTQDIKVCVWGKRSDRQLCQRFNPDKTMERVSLEELGS